MKKITIILLTFLSVIGYAQSNKIEKEEFFVFVDEMPQYPGGQSELMKFIQQNLVFPESAVKNKTYGKCFVKFIVRKDGKITDVMVLKGVPNCPECDEEAKKVFTKMPAWMPGKQNGKAVNVYYNQPINFQPR